MRIKQKGIVPGYVWQHKYRLKLEREHHRVIAQGGTIMVSGETGYREYALAWLLEQYLKHDYFAKVGWLSWYPRDVNEFTGARYVPQYEVVAIAIKKECSDFDLDNVRDVIATAKTSFIGTSDWKGLAAQLKLPVFAVLQTDKQVYI